MAKAVLGTAPSLEEEMQAWSKRFDWVFGVDEAGRGCLAGPVCAAVLAWPKNCERGLIPSTIRDSKKMTEALREKNFDPVREVAAGYGVGFAERTEIDRFNILEATALAVARALEQALARLESQGVRLDPARVAFLVDGTLSLVGRARFFCQHADYRAELSRAALLLAGPIAEKCLVKGDDRSLSIAAASVLAKVSRDRLMLSLDERYPHYEFRLHKGYSTARHMDLLKAHGPCDEHRRSFSPVAAFFT